MTTPLSSRVEARPSTQRTTSPLSAVMVVPKTELGTNPDGSDDTVIAAPDNQLTRITSSNEVSSLAPSGFVKAAYDEIELGASVDLFVLPFDVARADSVDARLTKVVAAFTAMNTAAQKAKLPHNTIDAILLPRESAIEGSNPDNAAFNALSTTCAAFEAVGVCDAGTISASGSITDTPTFADVQTWESQHSDPNIVAVTNRGDVAGYAGMFGSVIYLAHWAEVTSYPGSNYGIGAQPSNLRDLVRGVSNINPMFAFDENDGSSEAVVLRNEPNHLTSLIEWNGGLYFWGGRTQWPANDPRTYVSNLLISNRIRKEARRDLTSYLMLRGNRSRLAAMQLHVEGDLRATYVPHAVRSIEVVPVTLTAGHASVRVLVGFYDFIESIELLVEVFVDA